MVEAMIVRTRTSSRRRAPSPLARSAESAPMVSLPILIGTQMNAMSFLLRRCLAPVLSRNIGSLAILGTTMGWPVSITLPVTPSPRRYLPFACSSGRSPYASSMAISPLFLLRIVSVPLWMSMCSAVSCRMGLSTALRSRLSLSFVLISKRRLSSLISLFLASITLCLLKARPSRFPFYARRSNAKKAPFRTPFL